MHTAPVMLEERIAIRILQQVGPCSQLCPAYYYFISRVVAHFAWQPRASISHKP